MDINKVNKRKREKDKQQKEVKKDIRNKKIQVKKIVRNEVVVRDKIKKKKKVVRPLRESNPRPFPYQGNALPTMLRGHPNKKIKNKRYVEQV